jgi:hypothetical protein
MIGILRVLGIYRFCIGWGTFDIYFNVAKRTHTCCTAYVNMIFVIFDFFIWFILL